MSFLDFPGLQYFYNKYLKPIKPHAREETIKSYTVNEQGHVPDAQLVAQLKEENESLQAEIEKLNSSLASLSNIIVDTGYKPTPYYVACPLGNNMLIVTSDGGVWFAQSVSNQLNIMPINEISKSESLYVVTGNPNDRVITIRLKSEEGNIRAVIIHTTPDYS